MAQVARNDDGANGRDDRHREDPAEGDPPGGGRADEGLIRGMSMQKDEVLRRLEERLARGEISEKTYLEIRARYDAMPEVPPAPEPPAAPQPPTPPVHARHAGHAGHPMRNGDLDAMINDTVAAAT